MKRTALAVALALAALLAHAADPTFKWPHGEKAAVSLAYDDAIDSQLDKAMPPACMAAST